MILPSKELLSEVLNKDVMRFQVGGSINDLAICFEERQNTWSSFDMCINIYELQHKCKEWALSQGYKVLSSHTIKGGMATTLHKLRKQRKTFTAPTEFEAVVQACEYILLKDK